MNKKNKKIESKKLEEKSPAKSSRRDFLNTTWKGLGVIAGLELAGLSINYLSSSNDNNVSKENIFDAGSINDFPKGTITPFRRGHFYLARLQDGGFLALSVKCSHLGCSILWNEKENKFICPCHGSEFEINGEVKNPPAPRALDFYDLKIVNGSINVILNKKRKRGSFDKSQLVYA